MKTTTGNKDLIYKDVLTNVGGAYNSETGETQLSSLTHIGWCHETTADEAEVTERAPVKAQTMMNNVKENMMET